MAAFAKALMTFSCQALPKRNSSTNFIQNRRTSQSVTVFLKPMPIWRPRCEVAVREVVDVFEILRSDAVPLVKFRVEG